MLATPRRKLFASIFDQGIDAVAANAVADQLGLEQHHLAVKAANNRDKQIMQVGGLQDVVKLHAR